jgi:hypothetical protein
MRTIFIAAIVTIVLHAPVFAQKPELRRSMLNSGGKLVAGGSFRLIGSVSQAGIGESSSQNKIHGIGFWYNSGSGEPSATYVLPPVPDFDLYQNFPNPFSASTSIPYTIHAPGEYRMQLFSIDGRELATLHSGRMEPGDYTLSFHPQGLPAGVYFIRFSGRQNSEQQMMIITH